MMLRRIDYGDSDLIITFFTLERGKISVIAKAAKKSKKRFAGLLELFSVLQLVYSSGRGKGLPVLQEAALEKSFPGIRGNVEKTAYASYWAELINAWLEENDSQLPLYHLFEYALQALDTGVMPASGVSLIFQMRFMAMSGLGPNLSRCLGCNKTLEEMGPSPWFFVLPKGGIACSRCSCGGDKAIRLSKGTVKQLVWAAAGDLDKAGRIRFCSRAVTEGIQFMETFVPYYLGKTPRSLKFLQQIRDDSKG